MSHSEKQLLVVRAPVSMTVEEGEKDALVTVKGFASVESVDRSGDIISPLDFDIEKFMLNPQLMVNHKLWIDESGNGVAVGHVISMFAAKLVNQEDSKVWGIKDLKTGEVVSVFPKFKVPDLKQGDRGLFVIAEVTEPEIAAKVREGELSTFSWRGLVNVEFHVTGNSEAKRRLTDIDLFEVSLVNVPDNSDSSFVIGKSLYTVRLEKRRFESPGMAEEYLKIHGLRSDRVKEDEHSYFALQNDDVICNEQLVTMKMADGVHTIAGKAKEKKKSSNEFAGQRLDKIDGDTVKELVNLFSKSEKEKVMSSESTTEEKTKEDDKALHPGGCPEGMHRVDGECVPNKSKSGDEKKSEEEISDEAKALQSLGEHIGSQVSDQLTPILENQAKMLETLVQSMTSIGEATQKMVNALSGEKKDEEKKIEEKSGLDGVTERLNKLAETLVAQEKQIVEVAKSAEALKKITPKETPREEKVVEKKAEDEDPNAILDSLMPFFKD